MKHLLTSVAVGLIGLSVATTVQAQSEPMTLDRYRELSNKVLEAETRCWDAADKTEAYKKQIYRDYRDARFEFIKELYGDEFSGSKEGWTYFIKDSGAIINTEFKRKYQDDGFLINELMDCPPETRKEREAQRLESMKLEDRDEQHTLTRHFFPDREWAAEASVSLATQQLPQAGYGVEIVPGAEKFVAKSDSSLTGYFVGARISSPKNPWAFEFEYLDVDGNAEGQIANGTENVGIVYHDDTVGSTGVALGPRGLDVAVKTEYVGASFLAERRFTYSQREFFAGAGILVTDTEHEASVTTPSFVDISSESEQNIDETFFFLNANTVFPILPFDPNTGTFGFTITPGLEMGLRHAELASRQLNICGLCGAAEQNFTVDIEDDDFGFYYGGDVEAKLGVKVSDRAAVGVRGNAWWRSHTAEIVNPETGDDLFIRNNPTHLETDEAYGASISAFITASF